MMLYVLTQDESDLFFPPIGHKAFLIPRQNDFLQYLTLGCDNKTLCCLVSDDRPL